MESNQDQTTTAPIQQELNASIPSSTFLNPEAHNQEPSTENHKPAADVPQPFNQVDVAAMRSKIQRLIKMDNLADITLAGYMIKLLRTKSKMSFRELHEEVAKCYDVLRRSDGSKYTGDVAKALKGCLTSSEIFKEAGENVWGIREKEAKMYEDKTTKKLKTLINKKKGRGKKKGAEQGDDGESDEEFSGSDDDSADSLDMEKTLPAKKVKTVTNGPYGNMCNMLELYGNEVKADASMNGLTQNSFDLLSASNSAGEVLRTMNKERLMGIIECFEYFSPLIKDYLKSNPGVKSDAKTARNVGKVKVEAGAQENGSRVNRNKK